MDISRGARIIVFFEIKCLICLANNLFINLRGLPIVPLNNLLSCGFSLVPLNNGSFRFGMFYICEDNLLSHSGFLLCL